MTCPPGPAAIRASNASPTTMITCPPRYPNRGAGTGPQAPRPPTECGPGTGQIPYSLSVEFHNLHPVAALAWRSALPHYGRRLDGTGRLSPRVRRIAANTMIRIQAYLLAGYRVGA